MGLEFLERAAKSWQRGWNKDKKELELPTLFTLTNKECDRNFRAIPRSGVILSEGQEVVIQLADNSLTISFEGRIIGDSETISESLCEAVNQGSGVAVGVVRSVSKRGIAQVLVTH